MPTQPPADSTGFGPRAQDAARTSAGADLTRWVTAGAGRPRPAGDTPPTPPLPDLQAIRARLAELRQPQTAAPAGPPVSGAGTPSITTPPDIAPVRDGDPDSAIPPTAPPPPTATDVPAPDDLDHASPDAPATDHATPGDDVGPTAVPPDDPSAAREQPPSRPVPPFVTPARPSVRPASLPPAVGRPPVTSATATAPPRIVPAVAKPGPTAAAAGEQVTDQPDAPAGRGRRATRAVVAIVAILAVVVAMYFLGVGSRGRDAGTTAPTATQIDLNQLQVGDCLLDARSIDQGLGKVTLAPCSTPHNGEVYAIQINEQAWDTTVAEQFCLGAFEGYIGSDYTTPGLDAIALHPLTSADQSKRITCVVFHADGSTDSVSLKGSRR